MCKICYIYRRHVLSTFLDVLFVVILYKKCSLSIPFWAPQVTFLRNLQYICYKLCKNNALGTQKDTGELHFSYHTTTNTSHRATKMAEIQGSWSEWVVHLYVKYSGSYSRLNIFVIFGHVIFFVGNLHFKIIRINFQYSFYF